MRKTILLTGLAALLTIPAVMAADDIKIEERFDQKGDRIDTRLDQRGDVIDQRLDLRAEKASENGSERRPD